MDSPGIAYTPRSDATADAEIHALAAVYKFILDCHAKKSSSTTICSKNARKESENVSRNTKSTR